MDAIILYSTGCPRCNVLKQKLNKKGIAYEENDNVDEMIALGFKAAPVLVVNGKVMEFTEANYWINQQENVYEY